MLLRFLLLFLLACQPDGSSGVPSPRGDTDVGATDSDDDPSVDDSDATDDTDTTPAQDCVVDGDCDDGLACTVDRCVEGTCTHQVAAVCPWPASPPADATPLAWLSEDLERNLSGADWDAERRRLWLVRSRGPTNPSTVFRLRDQGAWQIDLLPNGQDAVWDLPDDAEGLTLVDAAEPDVLLLTVEIREVVREIDFSGPTPLLVREYDTSAWLPVAGANGAEGITFVPDAALQAGGFLGGDGQPVVSAGGFGGLVFVGHQNGGQVYVFDLQRANGMVDHVGTYDTAGTETAGLDYDASTGQLLIWHGAAINELEVTWLSSQGGVLDTVIRFAYPAALNVEGLSVAPVDSCVGGDRRLFLVADDEGAASAQLYEDWPCP